MAAQMPTMLEGYNELEMNTREDLWQSRKHTDSEILVGRGSTQQIFRVHSFMIRMTASHLAKDIGPGAKIPLPNIAPRVFSQILRALYTHRFEVTPETAIPILRAAQMLDVKFVMVKVQEYLKSGQVPHSPDTALSLYELDKSQTVRENCLKLFREQTSTVLKSSSLKEVDFDTLLLIFEQPELAIDSELELIDALYFYARVNGLMKNYAQLYKAMKKIRFRTLSAQQVASSRAEELLQEPDLLKILMHLLINNERTPMPDGFCSIREPRKKPNDSLVVSQCGGGLVNSTPNSSSIELLSNEKLQANLTGSSFNRTKDQTVDGSQNSNESPLVFRDHEKTSMWDSKPLIDESPKEN